MISVILFFAAAAAVIYAVWTYWCNTKAGGDMGADIIFSQIWFVSAIVFGVGTALVPGSNWWWGAGVFLAIWLLDIPMKSILLAVFERIRRKLGTA